MKVAAKVALGGVVTALSIVLMFLTGIVPFGTYGFPMFAGILLVLIVIEIGYPYAFSAYAAVSLLSLLILTDKEAALYFVVFLGYYPIVKSLIERIPNRPLQYIVKFILFNLTMVGAFWIGLFVFQVPKESYTVFGVYLPWVFFIAGNGIFILYDVCVTKLVTLYLLKWRKRFNKNTKL